MLTLKNIVKDYRTGDFTVHALKGVDLSFRKNEFVSVLGPSGCGKTTLLNIIGGLDKYTSGDLVINGISTKSYRDRDWDSYRNHSIGFVFQSYNLIPHQSVLSNVELALTLSGVSRSERRKRAAEALEKVGLGDQLSKKPNQMSGGQMQRVAIARALVNNPDILLADEPTGALDSATSVQIMELLKEIAKDKLVIMVTHNPELAEQYSSRIIRLLDGEVQSDSDPLTEPQEEKGETAGRPVKVKKTSMSFFTALSLSFNNLMTKKTRTLLTSFAGSIGIIGIALILSVSSGVSAYITSVEESTMSSYPITISETTVDMTSMIAAFMNEAGKEQQAVQDGTIASNDVMVSMMSTTTQGFTTNDLKSFKKFLEGNEEIKNYTTDIKYQYLTHLNTYLVKEDGTYFETVRNYQSLFMDSDEVPEQANQMTAMISAAWVELVGDGKFVEEQYTLVDGNFPKNENEVVLIVDSNNRISDFVLYMLGIRDPQELKDYLEAAELAIQTGTENTMVINPTVHTYEELYALEFKVLADSDKYILDESTGLIRECTEPELITNIKNSRTIKICGIVKAADESLSNNAAGGIGYLEGLMDSVIAEQNASPTVTAQLNNTTTDLLTGIPFSDEKYTEKDLPALRAMLAANPAFSAYISMLSDAQIIAFANNNLLTTQEKTLKTLGYIDVETPTGINIYPADFEAKEKITDIIDEYNAGKSEAQKLTYTDTVGLLMSSVTTIINAISYVLIAFVAISLVVSSIMIGIITYISVLERTKEIGILRAIGASKKDISRVFNAETITVGFIAGLIGILATLLLIILINVILFHFTGIAALKAVLPTTAAVILVGISVFLTFIAGLIPSGIAARKDPVQALSTE